MSARQVIIMKKRKTPSTRNHSKQLQPGTVRSSVKAHQRFRFNYGAGSPALLQFTTNNLLTLLVNLSTTVASGGLGAQTLVFDSARLRRVRAWATASSGAASAALDWSTTNPFNGANGVCYTDSQVGLAASLTLDKKPPKNSFANQWIDQNQTNYTLFTLNVVGAESIILDLDVDFILSDKYASSPVQFNLRSTQAWVAGQLGSLLFTNADNQTGSPQWFPVGVSNTY